MKRFKIVVARKDGGVEVFPMKPWLREHPTYIPPGLDATDSTSHQLRDGLRCAGWRIRDTDAEVRLIHPGWSGALNQINAVLGDGDGRVKILNLLDEKGGLPNRQVKQAFNLSDARYGAVRNELKRDGLVEKYRCRGGGIRLTRKGKKAASQVGASVLEENKGVPQGDPEALKSLRRAADESDL
jgi:hypothetical protein